MRKRVVAASAAFILSSLSARVFASISIEQIEAYEFDGNVQSNRYAPVIFGGNSTITLAPGDLGGFFPFITFHAVGASNLNSTDSSHAYAVGRDIYGTQSVATGLVSDVYSDAYDDFLDNTVLTQNSIGVGPAPGNFSTGVKVVNTSYVVTYGSTPPNTPTTDTDALRRMDSMVYKSDVTFVAGAVTSVGDGNYYDLNWSCFNSLAVSGVQSFSPVGGPGKQHADVFLSGDASFAAATVSGYAAALYGHAQIASQTDAMHGVVNRSMLMTGADKTTYTRQTANNLDTVHGAGEPNFDASLAILQSPEKPILGVSGGSVTGTPLPSQNGWSYGTVTASGQSVVLFQSSNTITGLTASLNWNVTSPITGGNINTSSVQFANLTLEVRPVTLTAGKYVLGANQSNTMLHSSAPGDNVQYLYDTTSLPAGTYAFLIGGDSSLSPLVGFSYALSGTFATQWNSSNGSSWGTVGNWTNGPANGKAAVANFLASPGLTAPGTIALDGDRTVGVINFNNINGYTIAQGTGGTLSFDDSGDSSGTANTQINVAAGNQVISAPISVASTLTFNVASGSSLLISGSSTTNGAITKTGAGTLSFGNTTAALLSRTVNGQINLSGGTLALTASATPSTRQLLVAASGLAISGTTDNWTGRLDLNNSDLEIVSGGDLATVTNQVRQGYNNGKWNGSGGILSTAAANNTTHLTALGILLNNQGGTQLLTTFDGATPAASSIFVKYTYYGDANLDGKVDGSDYSRIDNGFLMHLTSWYNGDFNYDGVVNGSDYTLIDNAFNTQGAVIASQVATPANNAPQISAVPEPSILAVMGCSLLLARRSRRHRMVEASA